MSKSLVVLPDNLRSQKQIKAAELSSINSELQHLITDNYTTLLGTSQSVMHLSKISHFLTSQLDLIRSSLPTLEPVNETIQEEKPKTQKSQFLEFLMIHETVSDYLEENNFLEASNQYELVMEKKDSLLANKKYSNYLSKRLRVLDHTKSLILSSTRSYFRDLSKNILSLNEQTAFNSIIVHAHHAITTPNTLLTTFLSERHHHLLNSVLVSPLTSTYTYILDTYFITKKLFNIKTLEQLQLLANSNFKQSLDFLTVPNVDEELLLWKRRIQTDITPKIVEVLNGMSIIELVTIAKELQELREQDEELIFETLFELCFKRKIEELMDEVWRIKGIWKDRWEIKENSLHVRTNLSNLFFEGKEWKNCGVVLVGNVSQTVEELVNIVNEVRNEIDIVFDMKELAFGNEFVLRRTKDEVFTQGFINWTDKLLEELYQMSVTLETNKTNPTVYRNSLMEYLCYSCFIHQCSQQTLLHPTLQKSEKNYQQILKTLSTLAFRSGQTFFDGILTSLRVPFLKDATMENTGYSPIGNIVLRKVAVEDNYYLTTSQPTYFTDRFYNKMNSVVSCLGNVGPSILLYVQIQTCSILINRHEEYLKNYGQQYAIQLLTDITIMQRSCSKVHYYFNTHLKQFHTELHIIEKLHLMYSDLNKRFESLLNKTRTFIEEIDFFVYLNDAKLVADDYYKRMNEDLIGLFPSIE
ncbi:Uncharacterized protein QTN25_007058 [Entamoeba marina]